MIVVRPGVSRMVFVNLLISCWRSCCCLCSSCWSMTISVETQSSFFYSGSSPLSSSLSSSAKMFGYSISATYWCERPSFVSCGQTCRFHTLPMKSPSLRGRGLATLQVMCWLRKVRELVHCPPLLIFFLVHFGRTTFFGWFRLLSSSHWLFLTFSRVFLDYQNIRDNTFRRFLAIFPRFFENIEGPSHLPSVH